MAPLRIRLQSLVRWPGASDDDAVGEHLLTALRRAMSRGGAPPSAVAVREDRVDLATLAQIRGRAPLQHFVAGLAHSEASDAGRVEAVGLVGGFGLRRRPGEPGVPIVLVHLEWPDCRWWHWRALVDPDAGVIREDSVVHLTAVQGDTKPLRLGGWWSLARRANLRVRLHPEQPAVVH